jgi:hypothetical protein
MERRWTGKKHWRPPSYLYAICGVDGELPHLTYANHVDQTTCKNCLREIAKVRKTMTSKEAPHE